MRERFYNMIASGKIDFFFYYLYFKDKGGESGTPKDFMEAFNNAIINGQIDLMKLNRKIDEEYN